MPVLVDPDQILPDKGKKPAASQVIAWLLYPVILLVGVSVGIVIGVKEAPNFNTGKNTNKVYTNAKIVTNVSNKNAPSNTNASKNTNSFLNANIFHAGDSARIDAATEAKLQTIRDDNKSRLVDKTADVIDILRQNDLFDLQFSLGEYYAVRGAYPSTDGEQIRLEQTATDTFYSAMKEFYGGSYYEKKDPQSPQYYYGYTSDGQSYTLSAYLTSKKKAFYVTSDTGQ